MGNICYIVTNLVL